MPLARMVFGDPASLNGPALARGVRRGDETYAVACLRWLGERPEPQATRLLTERLEDPRASVRRAAAWGLAWHGAASAVPALLSCRSAERTEEGQLALAVAIARSTQDAEAPRAWLAQFEQRVLLTPDGPRTPGLVTGAGSLSERFDLVALQPRSPLLERHRARMEAGSYDRATVLQLASLRHPADVQRLVRAIDTSGRREEQVIWMALGWAGAVEAKEVLRDALRATDVDPGRGFAQRRMAAASLGRLGLATTRGWLERALQDEALDYEGRPGAGLGIQYPVRTNLLWALGELADAAALPTLVSYLGNRSGSAFGGFYLPAMDAIVKIGPAALPLVTRTAREAPDEVAAGALGVLLALGAAAAPWRHDPRPQVRQLARIAEEP